MIQTSSEVEAARRHTLDRCVMVPTMGALHEGHASLIREGARVARERGLSGGCVVSIFVNPTQFNDKSDFERYPRTLEADLALCESAGASAVFVPDVQVIYPPTSPPPIPPLPDAATRPGLEDAHRPGHFAGVCQVVARLFEIVRPVAAIFGEKDWQQLQVVLAMAERAQLGVEIIGSPTIREHDGLAMSSRNRFLSSSDRARAPAIFRALCESHAAASPSRAETILQRVLRESGIEPEYAVVRDAATLMPREYAGADKSRRWRALIAARVGSVRLIDNCAWSG